MSALAVARERAVAVDVPGSTLGTILLYWDAKDSVWVVPFGALILDEVFGCVMVPAGYRTDLASVPQWAQSFIPFITLSVTPSVAHDFLYANGAQCEYTRAEVDALFLRLMQRDNVRAWRRYAAYLAVRAMGWRAWQPCVPLEIVV